MLKNYLKIAWKVLLRRKFFTFISLFGISFTLMILLVVTALVDQVFGAKPPLSKSNRIFDVTDIRSVGPDNRSHNALSYNFLRDYVKVLKTPEKVSIYSNMYTTNAFVNKKKLVLDQRSTDETFWEITDFTFLERAGYDNQDVEMANMVVVINENTKIEHFGSSPALGETIIIDGKRHKVCGVVEDVSLTKISAYADVWVPISTTPAKLTSFNQYHGDCNALILGKSKNDMPKIKEEFQAIMDHINSLPITNNFEKHHVSAESIPENFSRGFLGDHNDNKFDLLITLTIIGVLLFMLLPSINLININISRIMERTSEIGARRAFGATKNNLVKQFLFENIFLTSLGCIFGLIMAYIILKLINYSKIIAYANFEINFTVLMYGLILTVLFGLISGVYPAYKMSQLQPVDALKGGKV